MLRQNNTCIPLPCNIDCVILTTPAIDFLNGLAGSFELRRQGRQQEIDAEKLVAYNYID